MDIFNINEKIILRHASNNETYKMGLLYNLNHRVRRFEFDNDKLVINAVVRGSEDYDVSIYLTNAAISATMSAHALLTTAIQVHASTLWL